MYVPLFLAGFSLLVTLILLALTGKVFAILLLIVATTVAIFSCVALKPARDLRRPFLTVLICAMSVCVGCLFFLAKEKLVYEPATALCDNTVYTVAARVLKIQDEPEGPDKFTVEICELKNSKGEVVKLPKYKLKVLLTSNKLNCHMGDTVGFKSKLTILGENTVDVENKTIKNYYKSQGIYIGAYSYKSQYIAAKDESTADLKISVLCFADDLRAKVENNLCNYLSQDYAYIALGMLLGDKSKLDPEIEELFRSVGVIHLFSVSGFHLGFFSAIIYRELLRRKLNKKICCALTIIFILAFCVLIGLSRSTIRASIMLVVFYVGKLVTRDADSLNSLGLSAIMILAINPYSGGDFGFLLSFFATLGIISSQKPLVRHANERLKRVNNIRLRTRLKSVAGLAVITCCAFVFTLPFCVLYSDSVALISPLSNLLVVSAAETAILFSALGVLLSFLPFSSFLCYPVFFIAGHCLHYLVFAAKTLQRLPFYSMDISPEYLKVTLAAVLILFGFSFLLPLSQKTALRDGQQLSRVRFTFLLAIIIVLCSVFFNLLQLY